MSTRGPIIFKIFSCTPYLAVNFLWYRYRIEVAPQKNASEFLSIKITRDVFEFLFLKLRFLKIISLYCSFDFDRRETRIFFSISDNLLCVRILIWKGAITSFFFPCMGSSCLNFFHFFHSGNLNWSCLQLQTPSLIFIFKDLRSWFYQSLFLFKIKLWQSAKPPLRCVHRWEVFLFPRIWHGIIDE